MPDEENPKPSFEQPKDDKGETLGDGPPRLSDADMEAKRTAQRLAEQVKTDQPANVMAGLAGGESTPNAEQPQVSFDPTEIEHYESILHSPNSSDLVANLDPAGRMRLEAYKLQRQAAGNIENASDVLREAEGTVDEQRIKIDEWNAMDTQELKDELGQLRVQIAAYQAGLNNARLVPENRPFFQSEIRRLDQERRDMSAVLRKKTGEGVDVDQKVHEENRRKAREEAQETARINRLPVGEHEAELDRARGTLDSLKTSLMTERNRPQGERDQNKIRALSDEIAEASSRESVLRESYQQKKAADDKAKAEAETKGKSEEYERAQLENDSASNIRDRIDKLKTPFEETQKQIRRIEAQLAAPNLSAAERARLEADRAKLIPQALEAQKKIGDLGAALTRAEKREAETLKPGDKGRFEPMKNITDAEWRKMTDEQRQSLVRDLGKEKGKLSDEDFNKIRQKIRDGEDLSIDDTAKFTKELSNRLIKNGRRGYDMKELAQLKESNPEIYNVALDHWISSKETEQQLRELAPNSWQKLLKFAKGKSWLIALLILLVGGTTIAFGKKFGAFMDDDKKPLPWT